jgi:hypothetical protein
MGQSATIIGRATSPVCFAPAAVEQLGDRGHTRPGRSSWLVTGAARQRLRFAKGRSRGRVKAPRR